MSLNPKINGNIIKNKPITNKILENAKYKQATNVGHLLLF